MKIKLFFFLKFQLEVTDTGPEQGSSVRLVGGNEMGEEKE